MNQVTIYTDGASTGNPGPGGVGAVILQSDSRAEISAGYRLTTNNRMELMAAISGLERLPSPSRVTLYTDSKYLVNAITKGWAKRWRANKWKRNKREKALNADLWARLLALIETHEVQVKWVKGHSTHKENNRCDRLAKQAIRRGGLIPDEGYEEILAAQKSQGSLFDHPGNKK